MIITVELVISGVGWRASLSVSMKIDSQGCLVKLLLLFHFLGTRRNRLGIPSCPVASCCLRPCISARLACVSWTLGMSRALRPPQPKPSLYLYLIPLFLREVHKHVTFLNTHNIVYNWIDGFTQSNILFCY